MFSTQKIYHLWISKWLSSSHFRSQWLLPMVKLNIWLETKPTTLQTLIGRQMHVFKISIASQRIFKGIKLCPDVSSSSKHRNFCLLISFLLFLLSNEVNLSLRYNPQLHKFGFSMGVFLQQPEEQVFQTNHH